MAWRSAEFAEMGSMHEYSAERGFDVRRTSPMLPRTCSGVRATWTSIKAMHRLFWRSEWKMHVANNANERIHDERKDVFKPGLCRSRWCRNERQDEYDAHVLLRRWCVKYDKLRVVVKGRRGDGGVCLLFSYFEKALVWFQDKNIRTCPPLCALRIWRTTMPTRPPLPHMFSPFFPILLFHETTMFARSLLLHL